MPVTSHRVTRLLLTLFACLALLATACADTSGDDAADADATDGTTEDAADTGGDSDTDGSVETGTDARGVEVAGELGEKPEISLPGGEPPEELVVVDLAEGDGDPVEAGASVTTHYVGVSWLNDGEQFDASWDRGAPATFSLDQVIPGWTEGIPGMREGGRRLLIIPPDQAYGAQSPTPAIAENDTLVFVIDVLPPPEPIEPGTDQMGVEVSGELDEKPEITLPGDEPPEELVVVDLVEGDGEEVGFNATVTTHYVGVSWLNDGTEFDASWDRDEPATFPLSGVIPGWTEGIPGMRVGGRRLLIIPPEMAYGANPGSPDIAPDDTLVFVIDLVEFTG